MWGKWGGELGYKGMHGQTFGTHGTWRKKNWGCTLIENPAGVSSTEHCPTHHAHGGGGVGIQAHFPGTAFKRDPVTEALAHPPTGLTKGWVGLGWGYPNNTSQNDPHDAQSF